MSQLSLFKRSFRDAAMKNIHKKIERIKKLTASKKIDAICKASCKSRAQHWSDDNLRERADRTYERRWRSMKTKEHKLSELYETIWDNEESNKNA